MARSWVSLVDWLGGLELTRVVMESTGVYWKAVQRALFDTGVQVWICNAHHVKRVPGRKTDVSDSQWLATLARHGLVNPRASWRRRGWKICGG